MNRDQTLQTSFLYGANADYIESLQDKFEGKPVLDEGWRAFFARLGDNAADVEKSTRGPSWQKPHWPHHDHDGLDIGKISG